MTSQTFDTTGSWTCPEGVTSVDVQMWGGGAGGSQNGTHTADPGGGGGGGAYAAQVGVAVHVGVVYTVTVGIGGIDQQAGGLSQFIGDSAPCTLR